MNQFTEKVIQLIKSIPSGKVMTYGQIAKAAGSPRGARQVVRVLHSMSAKYNLPWHRVINAKGEIVIADEEAAYSQQAMLEAEGVYFLTNGRVDLKKSRYNLPFTEEDGF
ncbi:methylated-DNA-protein-cysteine methyltransferase related protein [Psychrobacillus sp. OK028]|uniref:MGMT family protein n=1 Tax=Psychrobacillus sp. OK028 TaxID=1884359 RepID=UPI00088E5E54|nr:MGMT family protein [Psychrobacillus sp. OK028]SDN44794.1 methylated-DNA-protein-cysteine methyltransferase related protein [Psychrobacillus sp. OK028]